MPSRAEHAAQAPHGRARADPLRRARRGRHRAVDDAAAALRDRSRARGSAAVLRRAGRDGQSVAARTERATTARVPIVGRAAMAEGRIWPPVVVRTRSRTSRAECEKAAVGSLGASEGARICSYSGRSRFSCARNSSVTCAASARARGESPRCRRACSSRMMRARRRRADRPGAIGMRCISGVCSISRHRLSAAGATSGISERRGLALYVVRGEEQRVARALVEAPSLLHRRRARRAGRIPVHPCGEFAGSRASAASARATGSKSSLASGSSFCTAFLSLFGGKITSWSAYVDTAAEIGSLLASSCLFHSCRTLCLFEQRLLPDDVGLAALAAFRTDIVRHWRCAGGPARNRSWSG